MVDKMLSFMVASLPRYDECDTDSVNQTQSSAKVGETPKYYYLTPAHLGTNFIRNGLNRRFRSKCSAAVDQFS